MTIEITSCLDCPFNRVDYIKRMKVCGILLEPVDISDYLIEVPFFCPLKQDNTITFKLKEDDTSK